MTHDIYNYSCFLLQCKLTEYVRRRYEDMTWVELYWDTIQRSNDSHAYIQYDFANQ